MGSMSDPMRPCSKCGTPVPRRSGSLIYCDGCRMPERPCEGCGQPFRGERRRRFCSRSCAAARVDGAKVWAATGSDSPFWKGGHRGYRGPGWPAIRDRIRDRDGWTCQECGAARDSGARLDVHHIVAAEDWSQPGSANDDSNLVTLCVDCHAKRHWDGSWRGRRASPELRAERAQATRAAAYQRDREKRIAAATRWNQENRERRNARERARRAARRNATG